MRPALVSKGGGVGVPISRRRSTITPVFRRAVVSLLLSTLVLPTGVAATWCLCDSVREGSCAAAEESCCRKHGNGPSLRETSTCGCVRIVVPKDGDARAVGATWTPPEAPPVENRVAFLRPELSPREVDVAFEPRAAERAPPPRRTLPLLL
jgi:hypothetical protein